MSTRFMGEEGFRWFFGIVEDRNDPKQIGRVRVRVFGVHSFTPDGTADKVNIPTEDLPWAITVNSITSAGLQTWDNDNRSKKDGLGLSPTGIQVGSHVFGFFIDGNECQMPVVLGTIAGIVGDSEINEVSALAREQNIIVKTPVGAMGPFTGEPSSSYAAKYPYNKVLTTESGHVIEIDDTPGKERIHVYHRSGTYTETRPDGTKVEKTTGSKFDVIIKDDEVYVGGNAKMYIKSNVDIKVDGSYTLNVTGPIIINGQTVNVNKGTKGAARIADQTLDNDSESNGPDTGAIITGSGTVFIGD